MNINQYADINNVRCYAMSNAVNYEKGQVNSEYNIVNLTRRISNRSFLSYDKENINTLITINNTILQFNPAIYTIYGYHVEIDNEFTLDIQEQPSNVTYYVGIKLKFITGTHDRVLLGNDNTAVTMQQLQGVIFFVQSALPTDDHYIWIGSINGSTGEWVFTPNPGLLIKFTTDEIGTEDGRSIDDIYARRYATHLYGSLDIHQAASESTVPSYKEEQSVPLPSYSLKYNDQYLQPTLVSSDNTQLATLGDDYIKILKLIISELQTSDSSTLINNEGIFSNNASIANILSNSISSEFINAYKISALRNKFSENYSGSDDPATIEGFRVWTAVYNDLAELYKKDPHCPVLVEGDLVVKVRNSDTYTKYENETPELVVGVYSPKYGQLLGGDPNLGSLESQYDSYIPVALTGRVKVKIDTPTQEGDLIVPTNQGVHSISCYDADLKLKYSGFIIGKALESGDVGDLITVQVMRS